MNDLSPESAESLFKLCRLAFDRIANSRQMLELEGHDKRREAIEHVVRDGEESRVCSEAKFALTDAVLKAHNLALARLEQSKGEERDVARSDHLLESAIAKAREEVRHVHPELKVAAQKILEFCEAAVIVARCDSVATPGFSEAAEKIRQRSQGTKHSR
jgi:hypothetical protein